MKRLASLLLALAWTAGPAAAQQAGGSGHPAEARNMALVGAHDLQARSAYQPVVHQQGGRWIAYVGHHGGTEASENFTPIYHRRLVFFAWFNAGVRALDIRDPFNPREVASYIPATTPKTDKRCVKVSGVDRCKVAIQTNNVEVDDRGLIYIVDRATTGLHILELTGDARAIAKFP